MTAIDDYQDATERQMKFQDRLPLYISAMILIWGGLAFWLSKII